jgi:hypothetical protein
MSKDFIYLNVPGLLNRYTNPSPMWKEKVIALAETQIRFFQRNGLIRPDSKALNTDVKEVVLRFSEMTSEGQAFIMSQSVERWMASCDKKGTVAAYKDEAGLEKRLMQFRTFKS